MWEAIRRLVFGGPVEVNANLWAFVVVLVAMAIDYSRSRALRLAAQKHSSQALEADALNFSTDIWSSAVVLLGLICVRLSNSFALGWLAKADAAAALGVAMIVAWVSLKLGKKAADDLMDRVPEQLRDQVAAAAAGVPGVREVKQVRVRRSGPEFFTDVTLTVNNTAPLEGAPRHRHANRDGGARRAPLGRRAGARRAGRRSGADAITTVRMLAARHGLGAHGIRIYVEEGRRVMELHLEVDAALRLEDAHRQATLFEQALHEAIPGLTRVVTHLEPAGDTSATVQAEPSGAAQVEAVIRQFVAASGLAHEPHDLNVQRVGDELAVSVHCVLDPDTGIIDAHGFTQRLETFLRQQVPNVGRVLIHVEPRT